MKKKLLLVGVAAMGLLAVGVGATSTFAWYTATAAGSGTKTQTSGDIAASVDHVAINNLSFEVTVNIAKKTEANSLILSHQDGVDSPSDTRKWQYGYSQSASSADQAELDAGTGSGQYNKGSGKVYSQVYVITVAAKSGPQKIGDITYTEDQVKDALSRGSSKITVAATDSPKRTHLEIVTSSTADDSFFTTSVYDDFDDRESAITFGSAGSYAAATAYLLVSIEGKTYYDTSTVNGSFAVTVSAA